MAGLTTLKEIVNNLLMWCLEWLLCLLHLMFLDGLTKTLVVTTKGLMNHHLTSLLTALSVLLPSIHNLVLSILSFSFSFKILASRVDILSQEEVQGMVSKSKHEVEASTFTTQVVHHETMECC